MKYAYKTEDELAALGFGWFNPPRIDASFSPEDFQAEHEAFTARLAQALRAFGSVAFAPENMEGDFVLSNETDLTRNVFVVCCSPHAYSKRLIEAIANVIDQAQPERLVVIDGQFSHKRPFYLCVMRGRSVFGCALDADVSLEVFGFPPREAEE